MRRIAAALTAAAVLALPIAAPSAASAATEFGDNCLATEPTSDEFVLFELSAPSNPLPIAAPSAGVITGWKVNLPFEAGEQMQILKVLRLTGNTALVVGESSGIFQGGAPSLYPTRIPVQAGDHLGLNAPEDVGTAYCAGEAGSIGYAEEINPLVGTSFPFLTTDEDLRIPVAAVLEPDADGDGFGDETQDKCPQGAGSNSACPVVLDTTPLLKKGKAVVLVATTVPTNVTVSGSAKLPKASASAKAKLKAVTKSVAPGKLNRFTLNFTGPLKSAIKDLPKGRSITVKLQASATDATGKKITDKAQLKVKGR